MRNDLTILWIDDAQKWQLEQKEILQMDMEDLLITASIHLENKGDIVLGSINRQTSGFKIYDIILVDYSLSKGVVGDQIINKLRTQKIDCDILFYSADKSKNIKEISIQNDFEGVYICSRDNFRDKVLMLIEKNIRKQTSILNIRGILMDQTSENDYIVNSYILKKYESLSNTDKQNIVTLLLDEMRSLKNNQIALFESVLASIEKEGIKNINSFLKTSTNVLTLELKYKLFKKIIEATSNNSFDQYSLDSYFVEIVKKRNTLAHKKIDICRQQSFIKYYDNINQYEARACPSDCCNHSNEFKISIEQWKEIRKLIMKYAKCFDKVLTNLE